VELEGAIVETVSVVMPVVVVPLSVTDGGEKLQLLCAGRPAHDAADRLKVPLNPFMPVNVRVVEPWLPGLVTTTVCGFAPMAKSGPGVTFTTVLPWEPP
jgi:hypothetical protein